MVMNFYKISIRLMEKEWKERGGWGGITLLGDYQNQVQYHQKKIMLCIPRTPWK